MVVVATSTTSSIALVVVFVVVISFTTCVPLFPYHLIFDINIATRIMDDNPHIMRTLRRDDLC